MTLAGEKSAETPYLWKGSGEGNAIALPCWPGIGLESPRMGRGGACVAFGYGPVRDCR